MVKLLEEFPGVHQNFNLVPSLVSQIQDYAAGTAHDPFLDAASNPAGELTTGERRFALQYLFQANVERMINRYPRYRELLDRVRAAGSDLARAEMSLEQPGLHRSAGAFAARLVRRVLSAAARSAASWCARAADFSRDDQRLVMQQAGGDHSRGIARLQGGCPGRARGAFRHALLPSHSAAALRHQRRRGILARTAIAGHPLSAIRRTRNSRSSLPSPPTRKNSARGRAACGRRKAASREEALAIAARNGIGWMATDEGVLGRTLDFDFQRDNQGRLSPEGAAKLYTIYRYSQGQRLHAPAVSRSPHLRSHRLRLCGNARRRSGHAPGEQPAAGGRSGAAPRQRRRGFDHSRRRECLGDLSRVGPGLPAPLL